MQRLTRYFFLAAAIVSVLALGSPSWAQSQSCPCFNVNQIYGTCSNPNTNISCARGKYITCSSTTSAGRTLEFKYFGNSTPDAGQYCYSTLSSGASGSTTTLTLRSSDDSSVGNSCSAVIKDALSALNTGGVTIGCNANVQ